MSSKAERWYELPAPRCDIEPILCQMWNIKNRANLATADFDTTAYAAHYRGQLIDALSDGGRYISARSRDDIIEVVGHIHRRLSREAILDRLRLARGNGCQSTEEEIRKKLSGLIELAARLVSMMTDIGSLPFSTRNQDRLDWNGVSLQDFVHLQFPERPGPDGDLTFEKSFTALNLVRIAGLKVKWTNNLADHLLLINGATTIVIFHQALFLRHNQDRYVPLPSLSSSP